MTSGIKNLNLLEQVKNTLRGLGIPGELTIEIVRELGGKHEAGIRLLRNREGKVSLVAKTSASKPQLCSVVSNILKSRDLRLLISSKLSGDYLAFGEEKVEAAPKVAKPKRPLTLLEELKLLEKKLRSIKMKQPTPACVDRLKRVRRFARYLDKLIALARAKASKMEYYYLQTHRAAERAEKAAQKALRVANSRMHKL